VLPNQLFPGALVAVQALRHQSEIRARDSVYQISLLAGRRQAGICSNSGGLGCENIES
jgi:hypothetical protein